MAGHVQDRWWRDKKDENGNVILNAKGKPVREKTELYGKGMRYKVRYYVNGRETSESFPDKQLRRAKDFLAKAQTDVLTGTYVEPDAGKIRLKDYVTQWRKGQSEDLSTQQTIETRLNGMVWPFFGDRHLAEISTETIRDWLQWMQTNGKYGATKASYRASIFDMMSAILNGAVEDKKIHENPCKAKSVKRPKPEDRKIRPWPERKLSKVQDALPEPYRIIVPMGGGLALRQQEIFAFSPEDIDRANMEVNIERQIKWIGKVPVFAPPKGGKSRVVPLSEGVLEPIDDYLLTHEPVTMTLPWIHPEGDLVTVQLLINKAADGVSQFRGEHTSKLWRGGPFDAGVWKPAFVRAGVVYEKRWDGMHALRHFCASNWLANGVSIKEVSVYLGHHDPGYTLRVYTHLMPSSHQRARHASNQVFKPRTPPEAAWNPPFPLRTA